MAESRLTEEIVGIGHLPNEVLFLVVARLDLGSLLHFRRTCRRFYAIANDPSWWSDITWVISGTICNLKNLKVALKISKKYLKSLSLVCHGKPLRLSKILHPILAYQSIHSISLTNFKCTICQIKMVLKLPALIELHMYNSDRLAIFDAVASTKSQLKILSIPMDLFCFRDWVGAGYVPPNVRLFVPAFPTSMHMWFYYFWKRHMMDYPPLSQVHHEARLSFCQPTPEFVSLSSLLIAQICFKPPNMKPFINCLPDDNDIFPNLFGIFEDSMGFNSDVTVYRGLIDRVYSGVLSGCVTSLHMAFMSTLTSAHLRAIAVSCPNLLHLDLQNSGRCLNDLNGLNAIASFCSKLEILNIAENCEAILESVNVDRLWHVIGGMNNLTVLTISCNWIPSGADHTVLPALKAIRIHCSRCRTNFNDFEFFASMPSLTYFRFRCIRPITAFSGFGNLLHSLTRLTHLHLEMGSGDHATLPTDACCYRNLENFCLECFDFIFPDELANAMS